MNPLRSPLVAAGTLALILGVAASAFENRKNPLDDGTPIASGWTSTDRFSSMGALGPDTVRFTTGDTWRVRAEGDPHTLERLRFVVKDGRLLVGRHSGEATKLPAAMVYVTAPAISSATLAGSGTVAIDRLSGAEVSATVAGSGDMSIGKIDARSMSGRVAGSGDLTVSGRSAAANLVVAGRGRFAGQSFTADTARAAVAGSGDVAFRSDGKVSATITGSGDVVVTGRASCSQKRIGSGALRCGG